MPFFGKKASISGPNQKDSGKRSSRHSQSDYPTNGSQDRTGNRSAEITDQSPPTSPSHNGTSASDSETEAEKLAKQLVFHAQLAHGSPTGKIANFTNVKELYQRIGETFGISPTEIMFCTLNSPKVDMEKLLGGQIGLEDLIFAHVKGSPKYMTVLKNASALGLTITDNGAGYAFIKRIREGSVMAEYPEVKVGDHISMINGQNMVGCRHFEVAKILREFEEGEEFTLQLVEAKKAFEGIAPRKSKGQSSANAGVVGSGRATLRLRSQGPATVQEQPAWETKAISKVDDLLESFLGIRDPELANTLVDLGKDKDNPSDFALAVEGQLGDFGFPDDFIFDIWGSLGDAKAGRI